jgi:hypothetical protein
LYDPMETVGLVCLTDDEVATAGVIMVVRQKF